MEHCLISSPPPQPIADLAPALTPQPNFGTHAIETGKDGFVLYESLAVLADTEPDTHAAMINAQLTNEKQKVEAAARANQQTLGALAILPHETMAASFGYDSTFIAEEALHG